MVSVQETQYFLRQELKF